VELEATLRDGSGSRQTSSTYLGFGGHNIPGVTLAMTMWSLGFPNKAVEHARQTIEEAASMDHPVTLSVVLIWGIFVFLWTGDLRSADEHVDWFVSRAQTYSMGPYLAVGRGFKGQLAILRGDAKNGVEALLGCSPPWARPASDQAEPAVARGCGNRADGPVSSETLKILNRERPGARTRRTPHL